jgi:putative transposase
LARSNEKQPYDLYQAVFYKLLGKFKNQPNAHKFRFKNPLYSLDASLIDLSLKLFPWAQRQQAKAAVKLHVGLNHGSMIPEFVALGDGKENDLVQGRKFDFPKGSLVALDKGYVDYGWYKSLTDKGVFFVARLRPNSIYQVIERKHVPGNSGVTSDQIIQLNSAHALKRGAPRLRRVGYRDRETGKHYVF